MGKNYQKQTGVRKPILGNNDLHKVALVDFREKVKQGEK